MSDVLPAPVPPTPTAHKIYIEPGAVVARLCLILTDQNEHGVANGDQGKACRKHVHTVDTIQWCAPAGTATVVFASGTPLLNGPPPVAGVQTIDVPQVGFGNCTKAYSFDPNATDRYKYTISLTLAGGALSEDPQVIIDDNSTVLEQVLLDGADDVGETAKDVLTTLVAQLKGSAAAEAGEGPRLFSKRHRTDLS